MKSSYKKEAWYLNNNKLIHGYKDKYGFHPDKSIQYKFDTQHITKKDHNKVIFYKLTTPSIKGLNNLQLIGGNLFFAIDNGMALTKVICNVGKYDYHYSTNKVILSENPNTEEIEQLILKVLESLGIASYSNTKIDYKLTSESKGIVNVFNQHALKNESNPICILDIGDSTVNTSMSIAKANA